MMTRQPRIMTFGIRCGGELLHEIEPGVRFRAGIGEALAAVYHLLAAGAPAAAGLAMDGFVMDYPHINIALEFETGGATALTAELPLLRIPDGGGMLRLLEYCDGVDDLYSRRAMDRMCDDLLGFERGVEGQQWHKVPLRAGFNWNSSVTSLELDKNDFPDFCRLLGSMQALHLRFGERIRGGVQGRF